MLHAAAALRMHSNLLEARDAVTRQVQAEQQKRTLPGPVG
jgi:hypothetical protein